MAVLAAASLLAGWTAYRARVEYTFSDPWGNLVTAQAILEHGTVKLDEYAEAHAISELGLGSRRDGHIYYFHPIGTPLVSLPAVWVARLTGLDMARSADNTHLQLLLAAATVAVALPLVYAVCRFYLDRWMSLAGALVFTFGSPLMSTLGVAWWSSNPTVLLHLWALLMLLGDARRPGRIRPTLLALVLGTSYLCRPTAAIFVLLVLAYLVIYRRRILVRVLAVLAVGGALFVVFSWSEYGSLLPPYYQPTRLGTSSLWTALAGNLVSPSRGLLVLCPYLLVAAVAGVTLAGRLKRDPFFWLGAVWFLGHWLTVSSYPHWWGGWSFGNRFFADAFPAMILMTAGIAREHREAATRVRGALYIALAASALVAIWIHSHQGLYDRYPFLWCQEGHYVEHLFDWRHPQPFASAASMSEHRREHLLPRLPPVLPGESIGAAHRGALFEGFSRPEGGGAWRWSDGHRAAILFKLAAPVAERPPAMTLKLVAGTFGDQAALVTLNGVELGEISGEFPKEFAFEVDPRALEFHQELESGDRRVEIGLEIPNPWNPHGSRPPRGSDTRRIGVRFGSLRLAAAGTGGA